MSKPVTIEFEGDYSLEQILTKLPSQYGKKLMHNIFAKAARPFVTSLRSEFNGSAKKGVTTVRGKSNDVPALWAGLVRTSSNSFSYQKAYWKNFGTLENRMQGYPFLNTRKRKTANWKGGVKPISAVDRIWNLKAAECESIIEKDAEVETVKFLNKYAAK